MSGPQFCTGANLQRRGCARSCMQENWRAMGRARTFLAAMHLHAQTISRMKLRGEGTGARPSARGKEGRLRREGRRT